MPVPVPVSDVLLSDRSPTRWPAALMLPPAVVVASPPALVPAPVVVVSLEGVPVTAAVVVAPAIVPLLLAKVPPTDVVVHAVLPLGIDVHVPALEVAPDAYDAHGCCVPTMTASGA